MLIKFFIPSFKHLKIYLGTDLVSQVSWISNSPVSSNYYLSCVLFLCMHYTLIFNEYVYSVGIPCTLNIDSVSTEEFWVCFCHSSRISLIFMLNSGL